MQLNSGKYTIAEIDGTLCSVVEAGAGQERMEFLKSLLEHNKYEVKTEKKGDEYTVGVTDTLFNTVLDVYKRRLVTTTGHKVTPAYWLQQTTDESELQVNYWKYLP